MHYVYCNVRTKLQEMKEKFSTTSRSPLLLQGHGGLLTPRVLITSRMQNWAPWQQLNKALKHVSSPRVTFSHPMHHARRIITLLGKAYQSCPVSTRDLLKPDFSAARNLNNRMILVHLYIMTVIDEKLWSGEIFGHHDLQILNCKELVIRSALE